jgi:predicted ATPase/class 3 adenylate cyclase/DNA-binding CsgD family transcriptional regulator
VEIHEADNAAVGVELPSGTVTFLLTDVEGSTLAWEVDRTAMAAAMARHDELLAKAIATHGGYRPIEQGEGDSVVAAFVRASDALAAAVEAQQALATEPLTVRMALHTGEAEVHDGRYSGPAIIRTARLRSIAHGGQVLVSKTTADVVGDRLPADTQLIDLGAHRLRDLSRREQVFQVDHPELAREFPPLRSLESTPNNLPVQLTSFIGRDFELRRVRELLVESRLLTLTGSGGCGKTRLATEAAAAASDRYPDGVWWVELAPVTDADAVGPAVLAALDVRDAKGRSPLERVTDHIGAGTALVVLDNCEHLLDACAELVDTVLRRCPHTDVLTTSREPLGVAGESVWRVPALSLPKREGSREPASLTTFDGVRLFIDRAAKVRPNFRVTNDNAPAVAEICVRLDGIPLAIELAAARVRALTPDRILAGLDDRFHLLTGGARTAMARQQTLEASVEWSHGLLSDDERRLLRRLSVFAGGFTLDAAEHTCVDEALPALAVLDLLNQLCDKSLVVVEDDPGGRYRLLETIRQFAASHLADAEEGPVGRDRHLAFYLGLAQQSEIDIERSGTPPDLDLLEAEHDNCRAALEWSLATGKDSAAISLATALATFWVHHGHYLEGQTWLRRVLEMCTPPAESRARALFALGHLCLIGMDFESGYGYSVLAEAEALATEAGDDRTVGRATADMAYLESWLSGPSDARFAAAAVACRRAGDDYGIAFGLSLQGVIHALSRDDHEAAAPVLAELQRVADRMGSQYFPGWVATATGRGLAQRGQLETARAELEAAVSIAEANGEPALTLFATMALAEVEIAQGRYAPAWRLLTLAEQRLRRSARGRSEGIGIMMALDLLAEGEPARARQILEENAPLVIRAGLPFLAAMLDIALGRALAATADLTEATLVFERAIAEADTAQSPFLTAEAQHGLGLVTLQNGDVDTAEALFHESLAACSSRSFRPSIARLLEALGAAAARNESYAEGTRLIEAATAARQSMGFVRPPAERPLIADAREAARGALGQAAFDAARAEGLALSLEDAVAYATRARGERGRPSAGWKSLTPVETDVVRLVAAGLTNPDIAERLFMARSTVKTHLSHVFAKLGVSSRAELASAATKRAL